MLRKLSLLLTISFSVLISFSGSAVADEKRALYRAENATKSPALATIGDYRALIIANNRYTDNKGYWKPLSNPLNDAKELQKILIDKYKFPARNVVLKLDADRATMFNALNKLISETNEGDNVLIFYAGHGNYDKTLDEGYWIPVDARGKDDSGYFSFATLRSKVKALSKKARHTLLISDSCFSGSFLNASRAGNEKSAIDVLASRRSVQILTAGGNEYVSDGYKNTGHSPFSYFLLNQLKNNTKPYLPGFELAGFIRNTVLFNSEQTPQLGVIRGAGHENGDFIFRLKVPKNMVAKVRVGFQTKQQSAEMTNLLAIANRYYIDKAYIAPANKNAYQSYLAILKQDPTNTAARQGLRNIAQVFINKATVSIQENAYTSAREQLNHALQVDKTHPGLEKLRQLLHTSEQEYLKNKRLFY